MVRGRGTLFDEWPDRYDRWFETSVGSLVLACEQALIMQLLDPGRGETILDAGCGTGIFTRDMLASGACIVGLDLSLPMLARAILKCRSLPFNPIVGDMNLLPLKDESFDKTVSVTALEFIKDAEAAVRELFRVTRDGGLVIVATLNSQSLWAERRREEAAKRETIFSRAIFRSPREMFALTPLPGIVKTAVHFQRDADPEAAIAAEQDGQNRNLLTGAFVAARWVKP